MTKQEVFQRLFYFLRSVYSIVVCYCDVTGRYCTRYCNKYISRGGGEVNKLTPVVKIGKSVSAASKDNQPPPPLFLLFAFCFLLMIDRY